MKKNQNENYFELFFNLKLFKGKNFLKLRNEFSSFILFLVGSFFVLYFLSYIFYQNIFNFFFNPLIKINVKFFHLNLFDLFFLKMNICLYSALFFWLPILFFQLNKFIFNIFKEREKFILKIIILFFLLNFYLSFFLVYKFEIEFFLQYIIQISKDSELYLNYNLYINQFIFIVFLNILFFSIPFFFYLLLYLKIFNKNNLIKIRKHTYFLMFVISAFFTPPDILYQVILGFILCIIYEIFIIFVSFSEKKDKLNKK